MTHSMGRIRWAVIAVGLAALLYALVHKPDLKPEALLGVWFTEDGWLHQEAGLRTQRRPPARVEWFDGPSPPEAKPGEPGASAPETSDWRPASGGKWTRLEFRSNGEVRVDHAEDGAVFATRTGKWVLEGPRVTLHLHNFNGVRHGPFPGQPQNRWTREGRTIQWPTARRAKGQLVLTHPNAEIDMSFQSISR